jgi:hypothetical protein
MEVDGRSVHWRDVLRVEKSMMKATFWTFVIPAPFLAEIDAFVFLQVSSRFQLHQI